MLEPGDSMQQRGQVPPVRRERGVGPPRADQDAQNRGHGEHRYQPHQHRRRQDETELHVELSASLEKKQIFYSSSKQTRSESKLILKYRQPWRILDAFIVIGTRRWSLTIRRPVFLFATYSMKALIALPSLICTFDRRPIHLSISILGRYK